MEAVIIIMILFFIGSILIFFGSYSELDKDKKEWERKRKLRKEIADKINKEKK